MKKTVLSLVALFVIGTVAVFAGSKTEEVKVSGNCGMCEERIETAAKSVDGVSDADWNKETKMLAVTFDDSKTSIDKVQGVVAKAGHDTGSFTACNDSYNSLPGCCQYDRETTKGEKKCDSATESNCKKKSKSCCKSKN